MVRSNAVTIEDVARAARVSITTVSNALNERPNRMRAETLARIEHAIARLGYRRNRIAQQLKTGQVALLGLLVPSIANPAYGVLAREVELAAHRLYGYRLLVGNTYRSKAKETSLLDDLLGHGVRGVIIMSSLADQRHVTAAVAHGLVAVSVDRRATEGSRLDFDYVSVNNFRAGELATQHLLEHGHVRIAFATASGRTLSRTEKIRGFRAAARAAGITRTARVFEGKPQSAFGDSEMAELGRSLAGEIRTLSAPPTGIVAVNDMLAIGLIAGFRDAGVRVPEDVSVVGMDDLFLSSLISPALTSVSAPLPQMAHAMVSRIVRRLDDPRIAPAELLFEPELARRSTVCKHLPATAVLQ